MAERTYQSASSAPPILLSRGRAAATVIAAYTAAALTVWLFLSYMKSVTGYDVSQSELALAFAAVMAALCVRALLGIYRRPRVLDA